MSISDDIILKEYAKRKQQKSFKFSDYAFPRQLEIFASPGNRFRTVITSRRFGKTCGIAGYMLDLCLQQPHIDCLYITITRENVRRIIWKDLLRIISDYAVECDVNNSRLEVTFPNGSRIMTGGAKDASEIEKFRGFKLRAVFIDECQSIRSHLKELINAVLIPALRDLNGQLFLVGTPGPVMAGAFYEYSHNEDWLNFKATAFQNPWMHNPPERDLNVTLLEECKIQGINPNDPTYQRENFGCWVEDSAALVIQYDASRNNYTELPSDLQYIIGVDIGFEDSDALCVLGFSHSTTTVYLIEEFKTQHQDITALADQIADVSKTFAPVNMVMDAGALGKKIMEELQNRHHLNIEAADKNRKLEYIALMNADLRRGHLRAKPDSFFAQDSKLVTWDRSNKEKPKISDVFHSDIIDAVLYAYRASLHYVKHEQKKVPDPQKDANEWSKQVQHKLEERNARRSQDPVGAALAEEYENEFNGESEAILEWYEGDY